ncbi:hypothetical protein EST38_g9878 [Candolleomyces aberdarensis]|uniref:Cytochrome P450 n=1 Tax=Candolleomyces aberdarensis TaxID=2316362 RepID=A0A4Q2DC39_9AGAR|nr:hypothetical protein EST38_g9878 [Candolleomyces aberdarensis]
MDLPVDSSVVVKAVPSAIAALIVWAVARRFIFPHPLDKVRGPPNPSLLADDGVMRIFGPFKHRGLLVQDPKALHHIFVKDQDIFEEMTAFIASNKAIFGDGLISILGDHHRKQRKMMNPVFSTAHIRLMTSQFFDITYKLRDVFLQKTADGPQEIDFMRWSTRVSLEIIAQSGFGTSWDPITEDADEHPFTSSAKLIVPWGKKLLLFRTFVMPLIYKYNLGTPGLQRFLIGLTPSTPLKELRNIVDTMHYHSLKLVNEKKEALAKGSGEFKNDHKDILSILMEENAKASDEDKLPDNEVVAQISTFTFAAMDTSSSALCRIFWLLAKHQDVQDKLRAEIREAKQNLNSEEPNYDQLNALPYLDGVIRETLRLYPPGPVMGRECRKDTILPLSKPIKTVDGTYTQEIFVPKDTMIFASLLGSNTNPELWGADTYDWKPERWFSPVPEKVVEARIPGVYSHLMTFIGGGRACIGFKFSLMEMKVLMYVLVDQFKFTPAKQEIIWTMAGLTTPMVDRSKVQPEMPIMISRAD